MTTYLHSKIKFEGGRILLAPNKNWWNSSVYSKIKNGRVLIVPMAKLEQFYLFQREKRNSYICPDRSKLKLFYLFRKTSNKTVPLETWLWSPNKWLNSTSHWIDRPKWLLSIYNSVVVLTSVRSYDSDWCQSHLKKDLKTVFPMV